MTKYEQGAFEGENVRENNEYEDFAEKTFADSQYKPDMGLSAFAMLAQETFTNGLRSAKFAKVFSPESFPLYGITVFIVHTCK